MACFSYMTIRFQLICLLMIALSAIVAMQLIVINVSVQLFTNTYTNVEIEVLQAQVITELEGVLLRQQELFLREIFISTQQLNMINEIVINSHQATPKDILQYNKQTNQPLTLDITDAITNVSNSSKYYQACLNLKYILPLFIQRQPLSITEHTLMILKDGSNFIFQGSGMNNTIAAPFQKANISYHIWYRKFATAFARNTSDITYIRQDQVLPTNPYEYATSSALLNKKGQLIGVVAFTTYITEYQKMLKYFYIKDYLMYAVVQNGVIIYNSNQPNQLYKFSQTNITGFNDDDWNAVMNNDTKNNTCINETLDNHICRYNSITGQDQYILMVHERTLDIYFIITFPKSLLVNQINNQITYITDEIQNVLLMYVLLIVGGGLVCIFIVFILSGCMLRPINNLNQCIILKIKDKFSIDDAIHNIEQKTDSNYVDKLVSAYHNFISSNKSSKSLAQRIIQSFRYNRQPHGLRQCLKVIKQSSKLADDAIEIRKSSKDLILIQIFKGSFLSTCELDELE